MFSRQFIDDTLISHFWSISKAFRNTVKCSTNSDVLLVGTDRALYFSVNMTLKMEYIFFCSVHTLEKVLTLWYNLHQKLLLSTKLIGIRFAAL